MKSAWEPLSANPSCSRDHKFKSQMRLEGSDQEARVSVLKATDQQEVTIPQWSQKVRWEGAEILCVSSPERGTADTDLWALLPHREHHRNLPVRSVAVRGTVGRRSFLIQRTRQKFQLIFQNLIKILSQRLKSASSERHNLKFYSRHGHCFGWGGGKGWRPKQQANGPRVFYTIGQLILAGTEELLEDTAKSGRSFWNSQGRKKWCWGWEQCLSSTLVANFVLP